MNRKKLNITRKNKIKFKKIKLMDLIYNKFKYKKVKVLFWIKILTKFKKIQLRTKIIISKMNKLTIKS
jgi:hypothetical protein